MDAGLFRQPDDFVLERFILDRREFVKEGLDDIRRYVHDKNTENKKEAPDPEPPVIRTPLNEPESCKYYKGHHNGRDNK